MKICKKILNYINVAYGINIINPSSNSFKLILNGNIWRDISYTQTLSEKFIREFKDYVFWTNISSKQKLSEDFIREFQDKVNWSYISMKQCLSEEFIIEFKYKVSWYNIFRSQTLSEEFLKKYKPLLPSLGRFL